MGATSSPGSSRFPIWRGKREDPGDELCEAGSLDAEEQSYRAS